MSPSERRERPILTRDQRVILARLSNRSMPVTIPDDLAHAKAEGRSWSMGYDAAYAACKRLDKLGLIRRLPGRPARWEVVR